MMHLNLAWIKPKQQSASMRVEQAGSAAVVRAKHCIGDIAKSLLKSAIHEPICFFLVPINQNEN
jgi:hypothetical protein